MPEQDILNKYDDVKSSLEKAIKVSDDIELIGDDENAELDYIRNTLNQLNNDFKNEIERLENSSEWEKFCIAFFGETNAGKSTIIETLRIVYDEEKRREEIVNQSERFYEELSSEKNQYTELIDKLIQLNDSIVETKSTKYKYKYIFYGIGLIMLGFVIGFLVTFLML